MNNCFLFTFSVNFIFLQISVIFLPLPLLFPHFPIHRDRVAYTIIPAVEAIPLLATLPLTFSSSTLSFPRPGIQCCTQCSWRTGDIFSNATMLCCVFAHAIGRAYIGTGQAEKPNRARARSYTRSCTLSGGRALFILGFGAIA